MKKIFKNITMYRYLLLQLLLQIFWTSLAFAQSEPLKQPSFLEMLGKMMPMFFIVFGIFYFMVLMPKRKEIDQQKSLIDGLQKGDMVATSGGIMGRVTSIESDHFVVESTSSCKLKIDKNHISKKL